MTAPTAPAGPTGTITRTGTQAGSGTGVQTGTTRPRPSWPRLGALAVTSFLTLALPVMWGVTALMQLVTGVEADHRFHQIIGQGLVLSVLWLSGLVPVVVAGWRRRPPSPGVVAQHAAFVTATVLAGVYAPQNGGLVVAGIVLVTTGLLWWALPVRLPLRDRRDALDPLATPLALLAAALLVPYGLAEGNIQHTSHDEHAQMSHYFDMAWVAFAAAACVLAGAVLGRVRPLLAGTGALAAIAAAAVALRAKDAPGPLWCAAAAAIVAGVIALVGWRRSVESRHFSMSDGAGRP